MGRVPLKSLLFHCVFFFKPVIGMLWNSYDYHIICNWMGWLFVTTQLFCILTVIKQKLNWIKKPFLWKVDDGFSKNNGFDADNHNESFRTSAHALPMRYGKCFFLWLLAPWKWKKPLIKQFLPCEEHPFFLASSGQVQMPVFSL